MVPAKNKTLAEKLKSLGVSLGIPEAKKDKQSSDSLSKILGGRWLPTRAGDAFVVEESYAENYKHGQFPINLSASLSILSNWAKDARIADLPVESLAFLDTETSGLSGGTGTYAFMVGAARFVDGNFKLRQFFMQDPGNEPTLLEALSDFLAPCAALVTYNGKAFDAPLLRTRYTLHSIPNPFADFAHIDLLPLARRLWRDRLPSRTLKYIEENVLGAPRSSEEVPGYEIPWLYFDYLRTGDAAPLKGVFYHNAMDIVAMAAMLNLMASMLEDPFSENVQHGLDLIALAKLYEDLNRRDSAARLYERGLEMKLDEADFWQAIKRLSTLQRRRGDTLSAKALWQKAAGEGHIYAHIELAKHFEHREKNPFTALRHTLQALEITLATEMPIYERQHWLSELGKRQERLQKKTGQG